MNIVQAIKENDYLKVKQIIDQEPHTINLIGHTNNTPLHTACKQSGLDGKQKEPNIQIIKLLIEKGADINVVNKNGNTILHFLVYNMEDTSNTFLLSDYKNKIIIEYILTQNISADTINIRNKFNQHILMEIFKKYEDHKLIFELFKKGAKLNNDENATILFWSLNRHHEEIVNRILDENNFNVNAYDNYNRTIIMTASANGFANVVTTLLKNNIIQINEKDNFGYTALMYACTYNHIEIIKLLLTKGADINKKNNKNKTARQLCITKETKLLFKKNRN